MRSRICVSKTRIIFDGNLIYIYIYIIYIYIYIYIYKRERKEKRRKYICLMISSVIPFPTYILLDSIHFFTHTHTHIHFELCVWRSMKTEQYGYFVVKKKLIRHHLLIYWHVKQSRIILCPEVREPRSLYVNIWQFCIVVSLEIFFCTILSSTLIFNRYIGFIEGSLTSNNTPCQTGPGSKDNKGVVYTS